ncbi:MAG: MFS transporter, partial [Acidimicrobiia bacterium]|nr:MFS transporter [Acidimicrobiia bacterium]
MKISHSALNQIFAAVSFVAGAVLAFVHSLNGAIGVAVLAAVVAGAVAGLFIARSHVGYGAGAGLAALAAFAG